MADEDIKLKGFEKASVYRGQKIDDDYLKRVLNMTKADIDKKALSEGLGIFGKDANTTKMLNEMLVEAGEKPYQTRNPLLRKIEVDLFSSDLGKSKMERMVFNTRLEKISNAVQSMKTSTKDKISYIRNTVKQLYPGISKASLKELPKLFGAVLGLPVSAGLSLAFSPSAEAAETMPTMKDEIMSRVGDFSGPSANSQLLEQMSQDAATIPKKTGGGMMNMDEMTRPLGYAAGGPIPRNKFDALMAEFDTPENKAGPGEPVGLEKIIAEKYAVDPRHTLPTNFPVDSKFLAREMGGDQGSILDDAMDIETLGMIVELQGVLSFDEIDKMKNMSPIQIKILYDKTFSGKK